MKRFLHGLAVCLLILLLLSGCAKTLGQPIMTWGDVSVTDSMYSYWLSTLKATFLYYYNNSVNSDEFWDTTLSDGETTEEYAMQIINDEIKFYVIGIRLFRELGLKIDSETSQAINDDIDEKISYYGRAELNEALAVYGINIDTLRQIYIIEAKLNAVYEALFGENGTMAPTDAELESYFAENYARVKYIQIYSGRNYVTNEDGSIATDEQGYYLTYVLSEEEKAEKQEKIAAMMADYGAGTDFATLTEQYSETDISYYENGFYLCSDSVNSFGTTLVRAALDMQDGEIRLVSDEDATYLVQRCPHIPYRELTEMYDLAQLTQLSERCAQEKYTSYFRTLAEEITVEEALLSQFSIRTAIPNSRF